MGWLRVGSLLMCWATVAVPKIVFEKSSDPGITQVRRLTTKGIHSFPQFSHDGRFIFATARGKEPYEAECPHIFRYDRADPPQPVSLVSAGMGVEYGLSRSEDPKELLHPEVMYLINTNAHIVREKMLNEAGQIINEKYFCPPKKCANASGDPDLELSCKTTRLERTDGVRSSSVTEIFTLNNPYASASTIQYSGSLVSAGSRRATMVKHTYNDTEFMYHMESDGDELKATAITSTNTWIEGATITYTKRRAYYAGGSITDPLLLNSVQKGVIPLQNGKLFMISNFSVGNDQEELIAELAKYTYVWPSTSEGAGDALYATRISPTGQMVIVKFKLDPATGEIADAIGGEQVLTDPTVKSYQAQVSVDGKFLTFISDRGGFEKQIYVATIGTYMVEASVELQRGVEFKSPLEHLSATYVYATNKLMEDPQAVQMSDDKKTLLFAVDTLPNHCPQIYQFSVELDDTTSFRKITSGFHIYSSPNFLSDGLILFTADLHTAFDSKMGCMRETCRDPAYKVTCVNGKRLRVLRRNSEIYVANEYGMLKHRLTANTNWDGEARVSPDGRKVAFCRLFGMSFELRIMGVYVSDDSDEKELKTATQDGFHFDIAFSPDGRFLTYASYRPRLLSEDYRRFRSMNWRNVMETPYSNIYLYDLEEDVERRIANGNENKFLHSPTFSSDGKSILYLETDSDGRSDTQLWRIRLGKSVFSDRHRLLGKVWNNQTIKIQLVDGEMVGLTDRGIILGDFAETPEPTTTEAPKPKPPEPPIYERTPGPYYPPYPPPRNNQNNNNNSASDLGSSMLLALVFGVARCWLRIL